MTKLIRKTSVKWIKCEVFSAKLIITLFSSIKYPRNITQVTVYSSKATGSQNSEADRKQDFAQPY